MSIDDSGLVVASVVGSTKTNIGDHEAAAGAAGLIRTALCPQRSQVPANLHFETPYPRLHWEHSLLVVHTRLHTLDQLPLQAAIASQGISSPKGHLVLGQSDLSLRPNPPSPITQHQRRPALSARTVARRDQLAGCYLAFFDGEDRGRQLGDTGVSAGSPRTRHPPRRLVGSCHDELIDSLRRFLVLAGVGNSPTEPAAGTVIGEDRTAPLPPREATQSYLSSGDLDMGRIGEGYDRCVRLPGCPWRHWLDYGRPPIAERDAAEVRL